jgi:hypothetical protein
MDRYFSGARTTQTQSLGMVSVSALTKGNMCLMRKKRRLTLVT